MLMNECKNGDLFTIIDLQTEFKIKKRLQDMGLTKGVEVKVIGFYANNAYILSVRGSRIVIGKDIAKSIIIELETKNNVTCLNHVDKFERSTCNAN